ncbi:hypothetical protein HHL19_16650 [Streptomyces sp. R302]|uniref:DUF4429 domain-containing protein n=1 Tax=unclassified Streptomyces TaxID=2593676 RepID=UPI00145F91F7|nr:MULTISPECIES: DUF4429 domain-containing protein [unclassified Streptomyces]NML55400.1 hypothetical protein [Streptomyces sp. R301]NML80272.1 hypothetical protein [Streptomyces sp. R302]
MGEIAITVPGVLGRIDFDGEWVTITKKEVGQTARETRIRAADVTSTRMKPATWAFHGYVQLVVPGTLPAAEVRGPLVGGRPPQSDPYSLSIRRKHNAVAEKLLAAVERARGATTP